MTDDDDILAAEFALGLLGAAEGEAVRVRAQTDSVLSLRIAWWRDQLAPLVDEAKVTPPAGLWTRIAASLPGNNNSRTLMQRWRAAAVGAMSVAAALAVFIGTQSAPVPVIPQVQPAPMVAMLSGETNPAIVSVSYDASTGQMTVAPTALDPAAGDAELWIVPEDGKPRSLGVIDAKTPQRHNVASDHRAFVHPGATFAISLEPKGGSTADGPTGPVVATGKIIRV